MNIFKKLLEIPQTLGKSHKDAPATAAPSNDDIKQCLIRSLQQLNCTLVETNDNENFSVLFEYQGGHFSMLYNNDPDCGIRIFYPGVIDVPLDCIDGLRHLCNEINSLASLASAIYTIREEDKLIYMHIKSDLPATADGNIMVENLRKAIRACFSLRNAASEFYYRWKANAGDDLTSDIEYTHHRDEHLSQLFAEGELKHEEGNEPFFGHISADRRDALRIGTLCETLGILDDCGLTELNVIGPKYVTAAFEDNPEEEVTGRVVEEHIMENFGTEDNEIRNFCLIDLFEPEKEADKSFDWRGSAMLKIDYCKNLSEDSSNIVCGSCFIFIEGILSTEDCYYFRVNYFVPTLQAIHSDQASMLGSKSAFTSGCFLAGYDRRSEQSAKAEFDFMWNEAHDAQPAAQSEEIDPRIQELRTFLIREEGHYAYWGNRYMQEERFYEAYINLQRLWSMQNKRYHKMTKAEKEQFYEISFRVGFCLYELKLYRPALHYLAITEFGEQRVQHLKVFINCCIAAGDFRARSMVEKSLENAETNMREAKENGIDIPDYITEHYDFLRRRKIYLLIDDNNLDEAENICKQMLDEPRNADYAINELSYIGYLRDKNKVNDNTSKQQ